MSQNQTTLNPALIAILNNVRTHHIPYKLIDAVGEIPVAVLLATLVGIQEGLFPKVDCKSYCLNMLDDNVYHIDNDLLKTLLPDIPFKIKKMYIKLERLGFLEVIARVENGRYIQFKSLDSWKRAIWWGQEPHYSSQIECLWKQLH